jgi:hypothetical protein
MSCCCGTDKMATSMSSSNKAGGAGRVNVDAADKLYNTSRVIGSSLFCCAEAQKPYFDEFGRDYGGNFKRMALIEDQACASIIYNISEKIKNKTNERQVFFASPNYEGLKKKIFV